MSFDVLPPVLLIPGALKPEVCAGLATIPGSRSPMDDAGGSVHHLRGGDAPMMTPLIDGEWRAVLQAMLECLLRHASEGFCFEPRAVDCWTLLQYPAGGEPSLYRAAAAHPREQVLICRVQLTAPGETFRLPEFVSPVYALRRGMAAIHSGSLLCERAPLAHSASASLVTVFRR